MKSHGLGLSVRRLKNLENRTSYCHWSDRMERGLPLASAYSTAFWRFHVRQPRRTPVSKRPVFAEYLSVTKLSRRDLSSPVTDLRCRRTSCQFLQEERNR